MSQYGSARYFDQPGLGRHIVAPVYRTACTIRQKLFPLIDAFEDGEFIGDNRHAKESRHAPFAAKEYGSLLKCVKTGMTMCLNLSRSLALNVSYEIALTTVGLIELGIAVRLSYNAETHKMHERPIVLGKSPAISPKWKERSHKSRDAAILARQEEVNQIRSDYSGLGAIIQIDGPLSL